MTSFYADHNISLRLVQFMRVSGYDITFAREQGLERAHDPAQLLHAATHDRVLLTHNERDFLLLHDARTLWSRAWEIAPSHAGVIVLPQQENWSSQQAVREIEAILAA